MESETEGSYGKVDGEVYLNGSLLKNKCEGVYEKENVHLLDIYNSILARM